MGFNRRECVLLRRLWSWDIQSKTKSWGSAPPRSFSSESQREPSRSPDGHEFILSSYCANETSTPYHSGAPPHVSCTQSPSKKGGRPTTTPPSCSSLSWSSFRPSRTAAAAIREADLGPFQPVSSVQSSLLRTVYSIGRRSQPPASPRALCIRLETYIILQVQHTATLFWVATRRWEQMRLSSRTACATEGS
jgi:hypothetical protein